LRQPNRGRDRLYIKDLPTALIAAISLTSRAGEIYKMGSRAAACVWGFALHLASAVGAGMCQLLFEAGEYSEFSTRVSEIDESLGKQYLDWNFRFHSNREIPEMATRR
jgi:nucleoside-diphosphate-sugar epimerase